METNDRGSSEKKTQFNIINDDPTRGEGGFGGGAISLANITPIIIDPENGEAFIDMGALHGRSIIEKKVRFKAAKEELDNPYKYWVVWIALDMAKEGAYYSGAAACEILVSREEQRIRLGYKSMPEHVNNLDKALKRKYVLSHMDDVSKKLLKKFLIDFNSDYWGRSPLELKEVI